MRKMKHIKDIITIALLLAVCLPTRAQWAGEDKSVLRVPGQQPKVIIGLPGDPDKCYEWTGPHIHGDRHKAQIEVWPENKYEVYNVHRIDDCEDVSQTVIVKLVDTITLISVTPKICCYNDGDSVRMEDFQFVTEPEGYESMIKVSPTIAHSKFWGLGPKSDRDFTFTLEHKGHVSEKTVNLNIYDESRVLSIDISPDFKNFEKKLEKAEGLLEMAHEIKDKVREGVVPALVVPANPCKSNFNASTTETIVPTFSRYCCNGEEIKTFSLSSPKRSFTFSWECELPTAWSLPYLGGIFWVGGFNAGVDIGPLTIHFRGHGCGEGEIPLEIFAEFFGGVKAKAIHDDFLSATIAVVGGGRAHLSWVISKEAKLGNGVEVYVNATGTIKTLSLVEIKVNQPVGKWTFFKQ
jgi:hypothetical protein